jgi:hypothetical protein
MKRTVLRADDTNTVRPFRSATGRIVESGASDKDGPWKLFHFDMFISDQ